MVFNRISLQLTSTYNQPYYRRNLAINPEKLDQEMLNAGKRSAFAGRNNNVMIDASGIRLYSIAATSVQLGVSKETMQEWVRTGFIKSEKRNRREWVSETEISHLLERLPRHEIVANNPQVALPTKNATGKLSSGKLRDLLGNQRDALLASARDVNQTDDADK
jgi:hypothetical protein